jgi:carboxyl-terminal processing protease
MIRTFNARFFAFLFLFQALLSPAVDLPAPLIEKAPGRATIPDRTSPPSPLVHEPAVLSVTNAVTQLRPGADAGRIAFMTAYILSHYHYTEQPFDAPFASKFLDEYINSLDPRHMHFLQSDIAEFDRFRADLPRKTLNSRGISDVSPAYAIFTRFMERLAQRVGYADGLLETEKFDFSVPDEKVVINRKDQPFPRNLEEAKGIWREWLRYEYLSEKLNREAERKAAATASVTLTNPPQAGSVIATNHTEPTKSMHEQIVDVLTRAYQRNLRLFHEWDGGDVLSAYLNALAHTYDPHSDYQAPPAAEDFAIMMNLSFFGIGASLQSEDGYCKIIELLDGPAMKSKKIKVGDRIVAVAQSNQPPVDIVDMPLTKAVRLIRSPVKGTEVRLTIIPAGAPDPSTREVVSLIRDEIKLESSEAKGSIIDMPTETGRKVRLGVIDLPSFYGTINQRADAEPRSTTDDVAKLLRKFEAENVSGVILDLRRNGGGLLQEAVRLSGLFIKSGPVVQVKDPQRVTVMDDPNPAVLYNGPLVVLTSRLSASASEIVAAALQDYGRALVVGDVSTFGKGSAQQLINLKDVRLSGADNMTNDPGQLKITNAKFYRATGASTEEKGVIPDIVLPSIWNTATDIGEKSLDNHMPWDTITNATFEKLNLVQPYLSELMKRSASRVATNRDFVYLRQDMDEYQKLWTAKTISLNEAERLKERRQEIAREEAREKERATRTEPDEPTYEITLKQVDTPGLPAPVAKTNNVAAASTSKPADSTAPANAGTNHVAVAGADTDTASATRSEDEWRRKAALEETERILSDYISLMSKESPVLVAHPAN